MRSLIFISTAVLATLISFQSAAANVTVRWTGKVPTSDCASNPISNQVAFNSQSERCKVELKQTEITNTKTANKMVSFDV
ncbi:MULTISPECIES: hypothetical protein [Vibrio]|jgi:hypothetical protein|uniref:hypothetical protein n=1 Tax=Vibrio TaxID=662 RepID=UPI0002EF5AB5|nr:MULTISPECIES: hypothetical protein [Vibrio]ANP78025.1 hypothetical protein A134_16690 [Vibrio crassostreae 9CS106]OCH56133.1 hypothetical protein A6D97_19880 [Vibrio sp. ZF57]PMK12860.1 hypothetical protein BCU07_08490 [Vibrio sp. 10N.261.54.E10]PMK74986.1 hypothetical protein BCT92_23720 [Vibrio sp. 10N.261.52.E5]PML76918.1 hypothetical protein BCT71_21420 [Vibrio sp. 10N.261.51.A7]